MLENIIKQYNKYAQANNSLLQKALTSATNVGEALIPQKLEQVITNIMVRLSPEVAVIEPEYDAQKFHEFNRITSLPAAGGAMGESAVTPVRRSTFQRAQVQMKVIRRKAAVTNFLQDSSKKYIDAAAAELENHLLSHAYDLATYILYGNATANQYEFDGLDTLISTNRVNTAQGGAAVSSLSVFDEMIDRNVSKQGAKHNRVFVMSPYMASRLSQLLVNTNVRLNVEAREVEIKGGWVVESYRGIPIIVSSACRPTGAKMSLTVTGVTGSGFSANHYFRIAPVTWDGEQIASDEKTLTVSSDTKDAKLDWTAYPGAISYKIYAGATSGALKLIRVIPAFTYDGDGTITGNVTTITLSSPDKGSEVTSAQANDVPLVATGNVPMETVFLWDLDKYQGLGKFPYTNSGGSKMNGLVTITPLAQTDDDLPFLIKTYGALCPAFEATSVMYRGLRIA